MQCLDSPCADVHIARVLEFAHRMFQSTTVVFYWVNDATEMVDFHAQGVTDDFLDRYQSGMNQLDPLLVRRLTRRERKVAFLHEEGPHVPETPAYIEFLNAYNIVDNLEFVFWNEHGPFAGLGVLPNAHDSPFGALNVDPDAVQKYLEFSLMMHPHVREARLRLTLSNRFKLTPREIEVVSLLCGGASNYDIAQAMGVGIATAKTHVVNILNKLGVDNRSSIVGLTMGLQ